MLDADIDELVEWIVLSKQAVLTGYFGDAKSNVLQWRTVAE